MRRRLPWREKLHGHAGWIIYESILKLIPGIDYINDRRYDWDSYLLKFTTALRIAPDATFNSRPEFRLFCTYAQWGKDFEGNPAMGGTAFLNQRKGFNFGVQVEHWW